MRSQEAMMILFGWIREFTFKPNIRLCVMALLPYRGRVDVDTQMKKVRLLYHLYILGQMIFQRDLQQLEIKMINMA